MIRFIDSNPFFLVFKLPVFIFSHASKVAKVRRKSWYSLYHFVQIYANLMDNEGNILEVYFNM